jgi:hypothetical protein
MYDSSYYAWNELNEALKKGNKNGWFRRRGVIWY